MKTINIYTQIVMLGTLLVPSILLAQTVNTGELSISPNTQFSTVSDLDNKNGASIMNDGEAFIYAHFNNDGVVDFTNGEEGLTRFEGTAVQQLSGGNISYFYDVLFNNASSNTASFELSSEISVDNEANFDEGIVQDDTHGGLFIFEDGATHVGTYDGSHVDGLVQKNGNDSFTYPIGDQQFFRYAAISAPANITDTFTAKYFFENPIGQTINGETPTANAAGVITLLDNAEFWTITRDTGNSDVLLTLTWDENGTTPTPIVSNPQEEIRIVRWDDAQQIWVNEGGIVDTANRTVTTPLQLGNYGIFTLARIDSELVLPGGDIVIYNGVTPNDDGKNDYFIIDGIENVENTNVKIFNRWGVKVFETNDYDTYGNVFKGFSDGRMTINRENQLPTGTYYYIFTYSYSNANGDSERIKKAGYLYLTTE